NVKSKGEYYLRDSESIYPEDGAPYGTLAVGETIYVDAKNSAAKWGESVGFRYAGLKNTSLYGEAEMSQEKNRLREVEVDNNLNLRRDTRAFITNKILTFGSRTKLTKTLDMTFQVKRLWETNDYDHKNTNNTTTTTGSAFISQLDMSGYRSSAKLTWKPFKKLTTALRYQLNDELVETRAMSDIKDQSTMQTRTNTHMFTYNISTQPMESVIVNMAYSKHLQNTTTPIGSNSGLAIPGFQGDYDSVLASSSYFPTENFSVTSTFTMSWADNFNDYSSTSLPFGVSSRSKSGTVGFTWSPGDKDYSIEPHYSYYQYDASSVSEASDYSAHVGWLDFSMKW
ncbi:MAG: hypothetical protein KC713_04690, partial [Candidatus Omnitrophica bacterium]|nr:hypothetical protein [Candidatus Omnitrophota bacterium]